MIIVMVLFMMSALSAMEKEEIKRDNSDLELTKRRYSDSEVLDKKEGTEQHITARRLSKIPKTPRGNQILYHLLNNDDTTSSAHSSCTVPSKECLIHTLKGINESIDDVNLSFAAIKGDVLRTYKQVVDTSAEINKMKVVQTSTYIDVDKIKKWTMNHDKMILAQNNMLRNCSIMMVMLLLLQIIQMGRTFSY